MVTPSNDKNHCCVYWIRDKLHTDIFTQGYVGITNNLKYRLSQHLYNCFNPNKYNTYRTDFINSVVSNNFEVSVVLVGSREYCLEIELKLRPQWAVGWNIAQGGGAGGRIKHGLSGNKIKKTYYNLLTRAKLEKELVYHCWIGEGGLETFANFYNSIDGNGELTLKQRGLGYTPENIIKLSRKDITRKSKALHDFNGATHSIAEFSDKFGIKANTITHRLRKGWSVPEAIGITEREVLLTTLESGRKIDYRGNLSVEQLSSIEKYYHSGLSLPEISKLINTDIGNLSRLVRKYNFDNTNRCLKIVDFLGGEHFMRLNFSFTSEQIDDFKKFVLSGKSVNEISKLLNRSVSSVYNLKKLLRWKDYEKSLGI